MTTTTLFLSNTTQAVRLPKAVAFPAGVREVDVRAVGRSRVITPAGASWSQWFEHGLRVSDDFLTEREQGADQERTPL